MKLRMTGGRKLVTVPGTPLQSAGDAADAEPNARPHPARRRHVTPLVKALARAFRWRRLLECGNYTSIAALAAGEGIDKSNASKILRLALLEPKAVESIVDAIDDAQWRLEILRKPFPVEWRW